MLLVFLFFYVVLIGFCSFFYDVLIVVLPVFLAFSFLIDSSVFSKVY